MLGVKQYPVLFDSFFILSDLVTCNIEVVTEDLSASQEGNSGNLLVPPSSSSSSSSKRSRTPSYLRPSRINTSLNAPKSSDLPRRKHTLEDGDEGSSDGMKGRRDRSISHNVDSAGATLEPPQGVVRRKLSIPFNDEGLNGAEGPANTPTTSTGSDRPILQGLVITPAKWEEKQGGHSPR